MTRILHLEIDSCVDCPYADQDLYEVTCNHPETCGNIIVSDVKKYDGKRNKIPEWCKLEKR